MPSKEPLVLKSKLRDFGIDMRESWRLHSDGGSEMMSHLEEWLRGFLVRRANTGGYDPAGNPDAEKLLHQLVLVVRCFFGQSGALGAC